MITGFRGFRVSVIIPAVTLAILAMPLPGVVFARTDQEEVASPIHAQGAFEKGSDIWVSALSHVAHPHPQHTGHQKTPWLGGPLTNKADGDAHSAVVARWHRD
jgi:hypothetical protein